ncbi:hypothetical protein EVAR_409_1 [Eumeta japonica]|uniref:PiggyBac transposable element-derived protein domain-containing protein n=1 Tax=Eumeta variegata TaxID=151549 RepID=A0A4C1SA33_EUMVA|nr:hypothetical protein EVAR_409_1 [Eumeta japonica]
MQEGPEKQKDDGSQVSRRRPRQREDRGRWLASEISLDAFGYFIQIKNGFLSDEQIGNILKNSDEDNDEEFLMLETEETSDCEDNVSVHSDEEDVISGSDDDDVPLSQMRGNTLRGKNGHLWSSVAPSSSRTPQRNVVSLQRTPQAIMEGIRDEKDAFMLLFSKPIDLIVKYTNQEIGRRAPKHNDQRYTNQTDLIASILNIEGKFV